MPGHAPPRTAADELSMFGYGGIPPIPIAYVEFWCKVVDLCLTASDAISKFAGKKIVPVLDGDTWARMKHKEVCDGLRQWARNNHTTVSRIPKEFFPTYERDSNYNFRQADEYGQDGMNIDDLISRISAWLPSYTTRRVEHHYYLATKQTLRIIDGLDTGEVEQVIPSSWGSWTRGGLWLSRYKWRLYARCEIEEDPPARDSDPLLYSEIWLFLEDLQKQLEKGIQWTDEAKMKDGDEFFRRQGVWEHHTAWRDPEEGPKGYTCLTVDQRTSNLGFKYIVFSKKDVIFGNDLLPCNTQPWNKNLHMETCRLFQPIWPKMPGNQVLP